MSGHRIMEVQPPNGAPLRVVLDRRIELGRECDGLLIDDPLLSRRHLAIWASGERVQLEDLNSRNGTAIGDSTVSGPTTLEVGATVTAGATTVRVLDLVTTTPAATVGARTAHRETVLPGDLGADTSTTTNPAMAEQSAGRDARATMIEAVAKDVVASGGAAVASVPRSGGTVTFLFSDIESSTQMAESMGDKSWFDCLRRHNEVFDGSVADHDGRVVKTIGDGYMITFGSARNAIDCAVEIQRRLADPAPGSPAPTVRVRMGLHTGEALETDGDLFGLHVNIAARVANLAAGEQILVSGLTRSIVEVSGDLDFGNESQVTLKGISGTHSVSELRWRPVEAAGPVADTGTDTGSGDSRATTVIRPE